MPCASHRPCLDLQNALSAPSCVWPDTAPVNARQLTGLVSDIGFSLYEPEPHVLPGPDELADCSLTCHAHLMLTPPWKQGAQAVMDVLGPSLAALALLRPWGYVLHPPKDAAILADFVDLWRKAGLPAKDLLLENVGGSKLPDLWETAVAEDLGVCLDFGHLLAFGQEDIIDLPGYWERVRMLHFYAPFERKDRSDLAERGASHRHLGLHLLPSNLRPIARAVLSAIPKSALVHLEVFSPEDLMGSLAALHGLAPKGYGA